MMKTRFNIGDLVWLMHMEKPEQLEVLSIQITKEEKFFRDKIAIRYSVGEGYPAYEENEIAATKEELRDKVFK